MFREEEKSNPVENKGIRSYKRIKELIVLDVTGNPDPLEPAALPARTPRARGRGRPLASTTESGRGEGKKRSKEGQWPGRFCVSFQVQEIRYLTNDEILLIQY